MVSRVERIRFTVLVDDRIGEVSEGLVPAFGLSIYVETSGGYSILFDTGPSPRVLEHNSRVLLGNKLSAVSAIVISHLHGDHAGGVGYACEVCGRARLYSVRGSSRVFRRFRCDVVEVSDVEKVAPSIYVISLPGGYVPEVSLVIDVEDFGPVMFVGCCHTGVTEAVKYVSSVLGRGVKALIGGFHLAGASERYVEGVVRWLTSRGVSVLCPLHCSGEVVVEVCKRLCSWALIDAYLGSTYVLP